jgi:hypothetical protein
MELGCQTYEQHLNKVFTVVCALFEFAWSKTDTNHYIYHCMVHGRTLDLYYNTLGDILNVKCECHGPKWHHHFILITKINHNAMKQRLQYRLKKVTKLDAPRRFYSRHSQVLNELHLINCILYILCNGRFGNHQHVNCTPCSISLKDKRILSRRFVEKYSLENQLKEYLTKKAYLKFERQSFFPVDYIMKFNKWIVETGEYLWDGTPKLYENQNNLLVIRNINVIEAFKEWLHNQPQTEELYGVKLSNKTIVAVDQFLARNDYRNCRNQIV